MTLNRALPRPGRSGDAVMRKRRKRSFKFTQLESLRLNRYKLGACTSRMPRPGGSRATQPHRIINRRESLSSQRVRNYQP